MADKLSLLDFVKAGGYDASLITTYAVSFDVYEQLLLRKLVSSGCRYNVLLADRQQLAKAWASEELRPVVAGSAYTLAPIRMGGAFHPKIWFLAGRKKVLLVVGSHNVTLAGLGYNKELTSVVELGLEPDAGLDGMVSDAWRATKAWVEECKVTLPGAVIDAVHRFEDFISPYLRVSGDNPQASFHVQGVGRTCLFDSIQDMAGAEVTRIAVLGPFLDARFEFLEMLHKRWPSAKMAVGITPEALLNDRALMLAFARCVDASMLGKEGRRGYVHAKALYLEGRGGEHLLAVGSANPSAPAWTEKGSGRNAEAVMVWRGAFAKNLADRLGLLKLFSEPQLKPGDVEIREIDDEDAADTDAEGSFVGVAAIDADTRTIEAVVGSHNIMQYSLHGATGSILGGGVALGQKVVTVNVPIDITLAAIRTIQFTTSTGAILSALVHHSAAIEPLASGNVREQVKRALASLTGDEGNLAEVIDAVYKVIFDDEPEMVLRPKSGGAGSIHKDDREDPSRPETLAVSASSMLRRSRKVRALKSGDLAYLIDILIHRLALEREVSAEAVDRQGRNEEEQVGTDDEMPLPVPTPSAAKVLDDGEVALLIGKKVKRLVNRMADYLDRAAKDDKAVPAAVARLIAVLALLRELRRIEALPRWRSAGLELVACESREELLVCAGEMLLGEQHCLLRKFESMAGSATEEAGQVRSLLTWLAWDVGGQYTDKFPLAMEPDDVEWKVYANAVLFELLPPIVADVDDLADLKESISLTASKTLPGVRRQQMWLDRHIALGTIWGEIKATPFGMLKLKEAFEVGDIAVAVSDGKRIPRVVALVTDSYIGLSTIDNMISFERDRVACVQ